MKPTTPAANTNTNDSGLRTPRGTPASILPSLQKLAKMDAHDDGPAHYAKERYLFDSIDVSGNENYITSILICINKCWFIS